MKHLHNTIILLFALTTKFSQAKEIEPPNSLLFENRAACALDSKQASQSALLIVDSFNAGKLIDSWIQGAPVEQAADMTIEKGLKIFRFSLSETWMTITRDLLNGRLPLLTSNDPRIKEECNQHFPCEAMDQHLASIFKKWKESSGDTQHESATAQSSCLYIKQFSEFQSNWNHDRPDQSLLQKIAQASSVKDNLFTDCFDESDSISSRRFILELDIAKAKKSYWKKIGFDFWYSAKLYFSYAWRHPEIILESTHPLNQLFKGLAVEQMIFLTSTGCKSIDRPECSQSQVSMDIFRSLGKLGTSTDLDKPLPDRPEQALISDTIATHREDAAFLPVHEDTDQWIKGYQDRIIQRRGSLKQRLLLAISQFELLSTSITSERIFRELNRLKNEMSSNTLLYQKLQVLCSEIDIAVRPDVNLLEKRFETTLQIPKFKTLVESSTDQQLNGMIDFYQSIAKTVFPICEQIRVEKLWKQGTAVATPSYSAWFRDLTGTWNAPVPQVDGKASPDFLGMGDVFNKSNIASPSFLTQEKITKEGNKESSVICADASDCVRMLLKSMVDLYAVSAWSDAMMPMNEWIQSPNLANPWASATACKVYDPWFATKQALVGLVTDLVTTTVTGIAPIPAYLAVQPKYRSVKEFNLEPKGDEVILKPVRNGPMSDVTVGIDLGPWTGIPCASVYSPTSTRPQIGGYYSVSSIRAEACTGKNNNRLIVNETVSAGENQKQTYSGCAMCYLNPYSAARGAATIATLGVPAIKIAVGAVFSGISLAKKLSNPIDVPRRYRVDLNDVSETFEKYSFIPKNCVNRLSRGFSCRHVFLTRDERIEYRK